MSLFSSVKEASCSLKEVSEGRKNGERKEKVEMNNNSSKIRASRYSQGPVLWFQINAGTLRSHKTEVLKIYRACHPLGSISAVSIALFKSLSLLFPSGVCVQLFTACTASLSPGCAAHPKSILRHFPADSPAVQKAQGEGMPVFWLLLCQYREQKNHI